MKKVVILLAVAVFGAIVLYLLVMDYFEKTSLRGRCLDLAGLVSSRTGDTLTALEREWWHSEMPSNYNQATEDGGFGENEPDQHGRVEWLAQWKQENGDHPGQINRHVDSVTVGSPIGEGKFQGCRLLIFVWHIGIPDSDWGERITYESKWKYENHFWRIVRLREVARNEVGPPPKD